MSLMKDKLPQIHAVSRAKAYKWDAPADILNEFSRVEPPQAAATGNVIDVLDVIGEDFWGEGVTAKAVSEKLKGMSGSVKVRVNSPGGDMFEGLAIYNMLRAHNGPVEIEVLGLAASAASIIAMAGDEIVMGPGSVMMIHNAWGMVVGNRHDMREAADVFETFDTSMVKLYAARTGRERDDIAKMMDDETFLDAEAAVEAGFATRVDGQLSASAKMDTKNAEHILARRRIEAALARDGVPRNERPGLISQALADVAPRDASDDDPAARDAGTFTQAMLDELKSALTLKK